MSWHEQAEGEYTRPCDANETFFVRLVESTAASNRARWTITVIAQAQVETTTDSKAEELLSAAWLRLRYKAPLIAARMEDLQLKYKVPNKSEQGAWLSKTFFVETKEPDEFDLNSQPQEYCSLHYFPGKQVIILRLFHWITDGIGAVNVLNSLLECLSQADGPEPEFGLESERLPPSQAIAAGYPTEVSQAAEEYSTKMLMDFVSNLPSAGLPIETPSEGTAFGNVKRLATQLDESRSATIVSGCKRHQISVTSAIHAAIAVFTQSNASPATKGQNYTSLAAINYRPFLPAPYNDHKAWPTGAHLIGPPFSLPDADFETTAVAFQKIYHQPFRKGETPIFDAYETFCKKLIEAFSQPPPPGMPPSTTPYLSSLGKLDGKYVQQEYLGPNTKVKLNHVEMVIDQTVPEFYVYAWSFRDRLNLSVVFDDAFYKDETVRAFLDEIEKILLPELNIVEHTK